MKKLNWVLLLLLVTGCYKDAVIITPVETLVPIEVDLGGDYESVQLKKVTCDIAIGKTIGHTNKRDSNPINFTPSDEALFEKRVKKNFYSLFDKVGYETFGGTDALFDEYQKVSPDYIIGAKIVDVRQNRKLSAQLLDYKLTMEQFLEIEWQVYSRQARSIVGSFHSKGYYKDSMVYLYNFPEAKLINIIDTSIRNSVKNLLADPNFIEILQNEKIETTKNHKKQKIQKLSINTKPINKNASLIRSSVISVKSGKSLGSGFIISSDGYALTNAHVVGSDSIVKIALATGRECLADVVYRDSERDVAMIKIEQDGLAPLPINISIINVGDEIYAMGSPLDETLSSTLTKGIVSAFRKTEDGFEYIQSDVSIQHGNSGGPLMDKYGNVVGMTVSGMFAGNAPMGLNFFIPIKDAIKSVGIELID